MKETRNLNKNSRDLAARRALGHKKETSVRKTSGRMSKASEPEMTVRIVSNKGLLLNSQTYWLDMPSGKSVLPRLGPIQCLYLTAVLELKENAYAARVRRWFEDKFKKEVNEGQINDVPRGLVAQGLLVVTQPARQAGLPKQMHSMGRPPIVHAVTPRGMKVLELAMDDVPSAPLEGDSHENSNRKNTVADAFAAGHGKSHS